MFYSYILFNHTDHFWNDAIRICGVNTVTNKGILKTKRINRVPGWDVRLKERVMDMLNQIF